MCSKSTGHLTFIKAAPGNGVSGEGLPTSDSSKKGTRDKESMKTDDMLFSMID